MELQIEGDKKFVAQTGEAFRVIKIDDKNIHLSTFEGDYVLNGPIENFKGLAESTGMKEISDHEYKLRVVAMRMFQDMKNDKDYPYKKSYVGQYEEIKDWESKPVEGFFEAGGGYRVYEELTPEEKEEKEAHGN